MFNAIQRVKYYALCYIHGVKFYGHSYTWSEALRSLLYMN